LHVQVPPPRYQCLLTYLFTWCLVSNGRGGASQELSFSGMSSAPVVFARTIILRPAHPVVLSCLYCCWKFSLLATALTLSGILFQLSTTLSPKKFCLSMRPFAFSGSEGFAASRSYPICCHVKPLGRIQPTSSVVYFVEHGHVCLVPTLL
jgi:hypothetical protein